MSKLIQALIVVVTLVVLSACTAAISPQPTHSPKPTSTPQLPRIVVTRCALNPDRDFLECALWLASLEDAPSGPTLSLDKLLFESGEFISNPRLSPDGSKVLFEIRLPEDDRTDIFIVGADGTGLTNLTHDPSRDGEGSWSPDSEYILFASAREGGVLFYRVEVESGQIEKLFDGEACIGSPSDWMPDGRQAVFSKIDVDTNQDGQVDYDDAGEIYVTPLKACNPRRLTYNSYRELKTRLSPDGRYLAFIVPLEGHERGFLETPVNEIRIWDTMTGEEWLLYQPPDGVWSIQYLSWEPTGERILFTMGMRTLNAYEFNLYLIPFEGGEAEQIGAPEGLYVEADW